MPRRLAVAKHATGFDAVGWTLLGFLLGASLAVFALLHADFHGLLRPLPPPPPTPASTTPAVVTYAPPATPLAGAGPAIVTPDTAPPAPPPVVRVPARTFSALASAGVASANASGKTHPRSATSAPKAASAAADAQVDDDAAAAGLTSRAGAAPKSAAASPDLY